jgi:hypothetical protein
VLVETDAGEERILARAVIDASGSYATPNPLGAGGVPALGERSLAHRIEYRIPDLLAAERARTRASACSWSAAATRPSTPSFPELTREPEQVVAMNIRPSCS